MALEQTIPKRQVFKAADVCAIAGVQPYILRSWEAEFQSLARPKKKGGARIYRRSDVEMVLRIKELVFVDGLTLGAARRKLEAERDSPNEAVSDDASAPVGLFEADIRARIRKLKQGLEEIRMMLSPGGGTSPRAKVVAESTAKPVGIAGRLEDAEAVPGPSKPRPNAKTGEKAKTPAKGTTQVKAKGQVQAKRKIAKRRRSA